jgi:hypothetical protein
VQNTVDLGEVGFELFCGFRFYVRNWLFGIFADILELFDLLFH